MSDLRAGNDAALRAWLNDEMEKEAELLLRVHNPLREHRLATLREVRDRLVATPREQLAAATLTAAWAQHLDDTAQYAGRFTEPERDGIRAAARMMRDPNVAAQVAKTVGGES